MSFVPAMKYLITLPLAGFYFVIMWNILEYIIPFGEEGAIKTFLLGLFLIGVPFAIVIGGGIRAIMLYQKSKYEMM